jgi:hypothetical protein
MLDKVSLQRNEAGFWVKKLQIENFYSMMKALDAVVCN